MEGFLGFNHNHCFIVLFFVSLSLAQYEHWPYLPGYPEPPPQVYQPPQRPADVPKIQLRLAGQKRKHNEGRVEVFYSGEWGTVCDDDFSIHAAHVICRELGYVEAVSWLPSSKYGKGEGKVTPRGTASCLALSPTLIVLDLMAGFDDVGPDKELKEPILVCEL